jgi:hypothetical protein
MGTMSTYLANEILDHILGNGTYTPPANRYLAAYTVAPTKAGGGTEVSGNGYARIACDAWGVAASGLAENDAEIAFAAASGGAWGTIVAVGLFDAATGGNFLGWFDDANTPTINDGDVLRYPVGSLDFGQDQAA